MTNIPFSEVTVIATTLGLFFLIVAFYKSIFHKRQSPNHTVLSNGQSPKRNAQPIKLADPFQQVSADALAHGPNAQPSTKTAAFYPSLPKSSDPSFSVFRQFNPNTNFDAPSAAQKNDSSYEWE